MRMKFYPHPHRKEHFERRHADQKNLPHLNKSIASIKCDLPLKYKQSDILLVEDAMQRKKRFNFSVERSREYSCMDPKLSAEYLSGYKKVTSRRNRSLDEAIRTPSLNKSDSLSGSKRSIVRRKQLDSLPMILLKRRLAKATADEDANCKKLVFDIDNWEDNVLRKPKMPRELSEDDINDVKQANNFPQIIPRQQSLPSIVNRHNSNSRY